MTYRCPRQRIGARWGVFSLVVVLVTSLLITGIIQAGMTQAAQQKDDVDGVFGPLVYSFATLQSYQQHMTLATNPLVLFIFDHEGADVPNFWVPLLKNVSEEFYEFGIEVADVATTSEIGKQLMKAMQAASAPVILFFQGVGDTPVEGGVGLKMPIAFTGNVDIPHILSWGLSCISSSVTHRVHNDADLARFFAKHPQYAGLPHVLYFPSMDYTPGGYLALSQHYASDAVFGVVPDAFATPDAMVIAHRYNITSKDELPVLLVLHKASADDGGEADHVVRMPATSAPFTYRRALAFLSTQITDTVAALVAKAKSTQNSYFLSIAENRRMYMARQLIDQQRDIAEEERRRLARQPIVVKDQATWASQCVRLPRGSRCLAVFVDSAQDAAAQENAVNVLSIISHKLLEVMGAEAQNVSLVVVDVQGSTAVRDYFDVGQNGFPDVILITLGRPAKYYNFVGAFSAESLLQFVVAHDAHLGQKVVRGGRTFIPHMVPKLEEVADLSSSGGAGDEGDL
ncbi:hypothetical protein JKF63_00106 [Porcisia hertigi]|uniref:Uncharacterized protein n=1 Tax=Porcisia hertigi TaxID=2761500 RepID=A0A836GXP4_9TRYP|nr:hypothetical protein JKF63_00106 [Porcisia hertigi]